MMDRAFKALKVTDSVYWVGALDWSIRDFHGYATNKGTTYNAFLVMGDEVALIDTVKAPFKDEMLSRIASVIDPERIDYIISNHAELDHAGCLKATARTVKPKKILASKRGIETLMAHHHEDLGVEAVKPGETLSLGNLTLSFIETPMLHWPESMFTFLEEEKVLFSQDAFGMHLATTELFVDQVDKGVIEYEAAKYYANILLPFSGQVKKLMEKVGEMDLGVRVIAPDHGPLWRNHVSGILDYYYKWSQLAFRNKAVVVYDTMWQSTAKMARALSEGLVAGGTQVRILPIRETHRSDIATELLDAGGLFRGFADPQQQYVPHRGGRPHLPPGAQTRGANRRGLRQLRLERRGGQASHRGAFQDEDGAARRRHQREVRPEPGGARPVLRAGSGGREAARRKMGRVVGADLRGVTAFSLMAGRRSREARRRTVRFDRSLTLEGAEIWMM